MRIVMSLLLLVTLAACQIALPGQGGQADGSSAGPEVNPITGAPMGSGAPAISVTTLDAPDDAIKADTTNPATTPLANAAPKAFSPLPPQTAPKAAPLAAAPVISAPATSPPATAATADEKARQTTEAQAEVTAPAPQPAAEAPSIPKPPAHIACEKRKGVWSKAGAAGANYCQMPTKDSGKSCTKSTQCQGYCLAKSNTCAPATPLLGCHDILTEDGKFLTQCIN